MCNSLHLVIEHIVRSLTDLRQQYDYTPVIYIGKTQDFVSAARRHHNNDYPVFLRVAEGTPEQIKEIEDQMIKWTKETKQWTCGNDNKGSGGNPDADKLYICLSESIPSDSLNEFEEDTLLGKEYPLIIP